MGSESGKNYSSKLRQEREGAANQLHDAGTEKVVPMNRAVQGTRPVQSAVHGVKKAIRAGQQAADALPGEEDLNDAVNQDGNVGIHTAERALQKTEGTAEKAKDVLDTHTRRQTRKAARALDYADAAVKEASGTGAPEKAVSRVSSSTAAKKAEKSAGAAAESTASAASAAGDGIVSSSTGNKVKRPGSLVGETVSSALHGSVKAANEDDNTAVQAADLAVEKGQHALRTTRSVQYSAKLHSQKKAATEAVKQSSTASTYYNASPYSRWQQRQRLKQMYAARRTAASGAAETASTAGTVAEKATNFARRAVYSVKSHAHTIVVLILLGLILAVIAGSLSSCLPAASGSILSILETTYTAEDEDILAVEDDYCALEEDLNEQIENIESDYPDYDEYNYDLAQVGHDPYQLAALLTVLLEDYTEAEALEILDIIFELQYTLEVEEVVEIRTRTVYVEVTDPETGETHTESYEEEYEYYILNVTLTNIGITAAAYAYGLTEDELERYEILLETLGNKEYLFSDVTYATSSGSSSSGSSYLDYSVSAEALTDTEFANMIAEAEKYLGMAYVWGGSSPSTGFDCSGFVCWVINNCGNGWYVGRTTANGLLSYCTVVSEDDLQPGDLVFFQGTYNTTGASHVGIYVGNGMMIHCGSPISYTSIETTYWQSHLLCYARLNQ